MSPRIASSSYFTSSSSALVRFLLELGFIRSDALPFSTNEEMRFDNLRTGKIHAILEGLGKLWPHFDIEVVLLLQSILSCLHGILDHPLESRLVHGVNNVRPLAIETVPVTLIWEMLQSVGIGLGNF